MTATKHTWTDVAQYVARKFAWRTFPIRADKTPACAHGFRDATDAADDLRLLFMTPAVAGLAVACGPSNLIVIDVDVKNAPDGMQWYDRHQWPATALARTPSGGLHAYFHRPELVERIPSSAGKIAPGVDVRCDGGYIICPPSRIVAGSYIWLTPPEAGIASCPGWLLDLVVAKPTPVVRKAYTTRPITAPNAYLHARLQRAVNDVLHAPEGMRNDTLNACAYSMGRLTARGLSADIAASVLTQAGVAAGLCERETRRTVASGLTKGQMWARSVT